MEQGEETRVTMIDGLVSMLSSGARTSDPDVRARLRRVQRTHFSSMEEDTLTRIHARVSGYSKQERTTAAALVVLTEKTRNEDYQRWLWDGITISVLTDACIAKAIYSVPFIVAFNLPLLGDRLLPAYVATSPEEEPVDGFVGRLAVELVEGSDHSEPESHLAWIGANASLLIPFIDHFLNIGSMDRHLCNTLITGSSVLTSGAI